MNPRAWLGVVALLAAGSLACGGASRPVIRVAAAADLRFAFEVLAPAYEQACRCRVVLSFGSSGRLSNQIAEGLQVDVFASADAGYVEALARKGLILEGTQEAYAQGRIVLAVAAGSSLAPGEPADLSSPQVRKISIANPEHAPYGLAAKQALKRLGLWEQLRPRLVLGENASIAAQYIETGDADAGIIPLSLAIQRRDALRYVLIDGSLHAPLLQVAAVIRTTREPALAKGFIGFINGAPGRAVMREYGFILPGELAQQ